MWFGGLLSVVLAIAAYFCIKRLELAPVSDQQY
jgi:hypothetical protein